MHTVPKGLRLHLGFFGRRNVGKSSLLNLLTRTESSIVSPTPGTTTDPVEKAMEWLPLGPVLLIDTAGIDDCGDLGEQRVQKTRQVLDRCDVGLLVVDSTLTWGVFEEDLIREMQGRKIPFCVLWNKCDLAEPDWEILERLNRDNIPVVQLSAIEKRGIGELHEQLIRLVPEEFLTPSPIVADLVAPNELVILVVPIDKEAPKGRLILPQVQTIRDLLDSDQNVFVVKDNTLARALTELQRPPALVVTDSQAFAQVNALLPPHVPLTSFSILFARQKGDIRMMVEGAKLIGTLTPNSRVLIAESCTHHPIADDIGREKIPRLLRQFVGEGLTIGHVQGHDFPTATIGDWDLVIHCGGCMWNRREMLSRIIRTQAGGSMMTNYGLAIAFMLGILDRAIEPLHL